MTLIVEFVSETRYIELNNAGFLLFVVFVGIIVLSGVVPLYLIVKYVF